MVTAEKPGCMKLAKMFAKVVKGNVPPRWAAKKNRL